MSTVFHSYIPGSILPPAGLHSLSENRLNVLADALGTKAP